MLSNALAWAHFKLRGGARNVGTITGGYAMIIVVAILLLVRSDPKSKAMILNVCSNGLLVLQTGILLLFGSSAVRNAIRKDIDSGMIHSHRLMPISGSRAILGYLVGATSLTVCLAAATFVIGLAISLDSSQSSSRWLIANVVLGAFSLFAWTAVALLSFGTQAAAGILTILIIMSIATGGIALLLLPAMTMLAAPGLSFLIMVTGLSFWGSAYQLSILAQLVMGAIFFRAAVRKFRRDDVLAFSPLLGLGLVATWIALTCLGIKFGNILQGGGVAGAFGGNERLPLAAQVVASVLVGTLLGTIPVMGSAWLASNYHRRRLLQDVALDSRPMPPELTVCVVTVILCTLPLYTTLFHTKIKLDEWLHTDGPRLAYTALTIALNLSGISYLMRILYRVSSKSAFMVGLFVLATWIGPLLLDLLRYSVGGMRADDPVFTAISPCGPLGCLIVLWGDFKAGVAIGLLVQAFLAGILGTLFHSTQKRASVPEARAASISLDVKP